MTSNRKTNEDDLNLFNPFHIDDSNDKDENSQNQEYSSVLEAPQNVKTRKRGLSLASDLLNAGIHKNPEDTLRNIEPSNTQSFSQKQNYISPNDNISNLYNNSNLNASSSKANLLLKNNRNKNFQSDIELDEVDNTYNSRDSNLFKFQIDEDNDISNDEYTRKNYRHINNNYNANNTTINSNSSHSNDSSNTNNRHLRSAEYNFDHEESMDFGDDYYNKKINQNKKEFSIFKYFLRFFSFLIFLKNAFLGISVQPPSKGGRHLPITLNIQHSNCPVITTKNGNKLLIDSRTDKPYCNNVISSSKYSIISFIPRQLYAQFSKLANCYFMCVAILQLIPSWSTTGTTTTIIPLSIFIGISIIREGFDDYRRHLLDKSENNRKTTVLKTDSNLNITENGSSSKNTLRTLYNGFGKSTTSISRLRESSDINVYQNYSIEDYEELEQLAEEPNSSLNETSLNKNGIDTIKTKWKNVKVGDIVKLECDEWLPCDILLLSSTNDMGEAFIETMALDGETNLKSKIPNPELNKRTNTINKFKSITASMIGEDPNQDLYNYEGSLDIVDNDTQIKDTYPIGSENVVYRGSILRNTDSCIGMVIFTGEESKIRMNAIKNPRIKAPKLQRSINLIVLFMVFVVISLSVFSLMAQRLFYNKTKDTFWYLYQQDAGVAATVMGFIIMYNTLIPLSLYVTMEIIKLVQLLLLQWDIDMYHKDSNTPAEARTATILEELGQVSYIFSDKTGTLTDNVMIFRKLSVAGTSWLHNMDQLTQNKTDNENNDNHRNNKIKDDHILDKIDPTKQEIPDVISQNVDIHRQGTVRYTGRPSMATLGSGPRPSMNPSLMTAQSWRDRNNNTGGDIDALGILSKSISNQQNDTNEDVTDPDIRNSLELIEYIQKYPNSTFGKKAKFFLLSIALCNTCFPKRSEKKKEESSGSIRTASSSIENSFDGGISTEGQENGERTNFENINLDVGDDEDDDDDEDESIDYQASSPDELALVTAAGDMGFMLYERKHKSLTLKTYPNGFDKDPVLEAYTILDVVDFTSDRKRMSVIVKFPNGEICILCKGADNIISSRLKDKELVKSKQDELSRTISLRRKEEAEFVLNRNSTDAVIRNSISSLGRRSTTLARTSLHLQHQGSSYMGQQLEQGQHSTIDDILMAESDNRDGLRNIQLKSIESLRKSQSIKYGSNMPIVPTSKPKGTIDPLNNANIEANVSSSDLSNYIPNNNLISNNAYIVEKTLEHINDFSREGLRTLLYAYKWIDEKTYNKWAVEYAEAKASLNNRSDNISRVGEILENEFELCGATAIEDKLQEGVPQAIQKLRKAGIKLWMLTGDKRETAINIGYSCKLIKDYSTVIILSIDDGLDEISNKMAAAELEVDAGNVAHCVVVIDGRTLSSLEEDPTLLSLFIALGVKAHSVICCRASPAQKAKMVSAVRELDSSKVTLAIGDGANDIAMIQSADVGVGITGKEGLQAARTSDYSIAQFRYLLKLLLVHGRYNYVRTSKFVLCTFYKEMFFYLTQLLYQRYTLFTGSSLYESWSLSMFNTLFTSLPVLCIGMFEKDLRPSTLLAIPQLYSKGRNFESFNLKLFIMWVLLATSQAVTLCFALWNIYGFNAAFDNTTYGLCVIMFTVLIIIINTKCNVLEMHNVTKISFASWFTSVAGWMVWCLLLTALYKTKDSTIFYVTTGLLQHFGKDVNFWGTILILVIIGISIEFLFQTIRYYVWPTDTDTFQVLEKITDIRRQMEFLSFEEMKQGWTWLHESQIIQEEMPNKSDFYKWTYSMRSLIKKGTMGPSKETRKRAGTLVNPTELPPGSPSIVRFNSNSDRFEDEMLPSGKIIRKRNNNEFPSNSGNKKFMKLFKIKEENDESYEDDIEAVLARRRRELGEEL